MLMQRHVLRLQWLSGLFLRQRLLLNLELAVSARQTCPRPWDPPVSVPSSMPPHLAFHVDAKDRNSGVHACAAGTLPAEVDKTCCLLHFLHMNSESNR